MAIRRSINAISITSILLLPIAVSSSESDCAPYPIEVGLRNVTVGKTVARGVSLTLGEPEQSFAFLPQWPLNSTFVYGTNGYCSDSMSDDACETFRGGGYDESTSTTRQYSDPDSNLAEASPYPALSWLTEDLKLNVNATLDDFPIGIARDDWGAQGYHPQAAFGLGKNSTILNALYSAGMIASHSWAMFWGRTGAYESTQQDGSFVFGGYDRAKTSGENYTSQLNYANSGCPTGMLVTISDLVLNFANGTTYSLFNSIQSSAMSACIVPDYPVLMTMPRDPWFKKFETATGHSIDTRSFGIYYYGMLYENSSYAYNGDITISLSSGFSVRIPNDQLVVPDLKIDKISGNLVADGSTPELVINAMQQGNADDLPQLGRQFLSSAYLLLNQDANSFTLWKASQNTGIDLVAVDEKNRQQDNFCNPSKNDKNDTSFPASTATNLPGTSNDSDNHGGGIAPGTIAGIVVGCVAGVSIIAGAAFVWVVRKKRQNGHRRPELGYTRRYPVDMYATKQSPNELGSYDLKPGFRHELPAQNRSTASFGVPELP